MHHNTSSLSYWVHMNECVQAADAVDSVLCLSSANWTWHPTLPLYINRGFRQVCHLTLTDQSCHVLYSIYFPFKSGRRIQYFSCMRVSVTAPLAAYSRSDFLLKPVWSCLLHLSCERKMDQWFLMNSNLTANSFIRWSWTFIDRLDDAISFEVLIIVELFIVWPLLLSPTAASWYTCRLLIVAMLNGVLEIQRGVSAAIWADRRAASPWAVVPSAMWRGLTRCDALCWNPLLKY